MTLLACYPTRRQLLVVAAALLLAFILPAFFPDSLPVLTALCLLLAGLFVADLLILLKLEAITVKRVIPATIAVDHSATMSLQFRHSNPLTLHAAVADCLPDSFNADRTPPVVALAPRKTTSVSFAIEPVMRGCFDPEFTEISVRGVMGLVDVRFRLDCRSRVKVYPDFDAIRAYTILATDNHVSQIGIFKRIARGEGSEFHQLRQYQTGDSLRQVNWKATARRQQLISNEYQRERDQQVVLLVDNGRRMRSRDDALSHFDHALNASILLSYIALRQGDSVGLLSFGHTRRWVPIGRGEGYSAVILNNLYDLQPGNSASDYIGAAEELTVHQRKRSLVVILTNTRDEDLEDLVAACRILRGRHLVLLANIREHFIHKALQEPVTTLRQALRYSAMYDYNRHRSATLATLRAHGVHCVDCTADQLPAAVSNAYLEFKSSGML